MYRDYKQTFSYEAQGDFGVPRDISVQEFRKGTRDLLEIIGHHYESTGNSPETKGKIRIGTRDVIFKNLEQEASTETIFDFSGEVPFHTYHSRGCIRTGVATTHVEKYVAQTAVGFVLSLIPPIFVLTRDMDLLWALTGLVPGVIIAAPGIYEVCREEERQKIKTLELEFHVLEKRSGHTGQVENLLRFLQEYKIRPQKP